MMRRNNGATLEELLDASKALGIHMYACEMTMHILGLEKDDFIHEVEDVSGVATFLKLSPQPTGARLHKVLCVQHVERSTYKIMIEK